MGKGKKKRSKEEKSIVQTVALSIPARDVCCILKAQVARYELIATATSAAITAQNLVGTLNVMASSATAVYSTFYAIRIRRITFYTTAVVSSATSAMAFEWFTISGSTFGSIPSSIVLGSVGTAAGGKHSFIPPKLSPWSKWITLLAPGGGSCFIYSAPAGTTIDVEYDACIDNGDSTVTYTVVGAVTGSNYRMGLDGLATATSNWNVLGYRKI